MEHLTFWQQVIIAVAHQAGSVLATISGLAVVYLKLRNKQDARHQEITVMLNGELERKIRAAIAEPRDSIGE